MTKEEFFSLLEEVLEVQPGTVKSGMNLEQDLAAWDSMAAVSFVAMADAHFGVSVSPSALAKCQTVEDLIGLLEGKVTV